MRPETQKQQTATNSRIKTSRDLCEGNRVLIEVKIFQDWTIAYISTVSDALSRFRLCKGFPEVAKRTAKDARGNTVGTTEEWRSHDDDITVALYLRSTQCHVLLQE